MSAFFERSPIYAHSARPDIEGDNRMGMEDHEKHAFTKVLHSVGTVMLKFGAFENAKIIATTINSDSQSTSGSNNSYERIK
jgi:hypothetical protein